MYAVNAMGLLRVSPEGETLRSRSARARHLGLSGVRHFRRWASRPRWCCTPPEGGIAGDHASRRTDQLSTRPVQDDDRDQVAARCVLGPRLTVAVRRVATPHQRHVSCILSCMNRRAFVSTSGAAAMALGSSLTPKTASAAPAPKALMKLGCQSAPTNETHLKYFARYGVRNICGYPTIADGPALRHGGRTQEDARPGRCERHQHRLPVAAVPRLQPHRPRKASRHHAGAEPGARPRYRGHADHDPQLRRRGNSVHQIQHEHPRRAAHRTLAGTRRRHLQHLELEERPSRNAA